MFRPFQSALASAVLATSALVATAAPAAALPVGELLPMDAELEFVHDKAEALTDLQGRAILIEFFAHW